MSRPGREVCVEVRGRESGGFEDVVEGRDAHEHAGVTLPQGGGVDARLLQRLPSRLKGEALLRVDAQGFPWEDTEKKAASKRSMSLRKPPRGRSPVGPLSESGSGAICRRSSAGRGRMPDRPSRRKSANSSAP
ncbi:hypothetical protein AQJ11_41180 [Streptomyces corchorusii]|uniref:Uncharacterized protein n=1 Tax=Streptomyces corchorusii TaxID=1903 RepID=A0A117Q9H0_STRCK|nr:hypothetical protein AQJ11_41180 [Streptomyces corchorusii]